MLSLPVTVDLCCKRLLQALSWTVSGWRCRQLRRTRALCPGCSWQWRCRASFIWTAWAKRYLRESIRRFFELSIAHWVAYTLLHTLHQWAKPSGLFRLRQKAPWGLTSLQF